MSGQRGHMNSRPAREIFLTSSSLSFSSLSSSVSWDDAVELNTKNPKTSYNEDKSQQINEASSSSHEGSEISGVTHVRIQPDPSPPSRLGPAQLTNKGLGNYDPERISASVFAKTGDMNWSEISNESLFSLKVDGCRISNAQAARQRYVKPKEVLMSGEYLRYTPSLLIRSGDAEEKRSDVEEEVKSGEIGVENRRCQDKSSSTQDVSWSTNSNTNNSYSLNQAPPTKVQSFSIPVGEKKSKKRTKTKMMSKKKEKKKKKRCMWSWLCSGFSKCECDLCCYKLRKCSCCCRGPKAIVL